MENPAWLVLSEDKHVAMQLHDNSWVSAASSMAHAWLFSQKALPALVAGKRQLFLRRMHHLAGSE